MSSGTSIRVASRSHSAFAAGGEASSRRSAARPPRATPTGCRPCGTRRGARRRSRSGPRSGTAGRRAARPGRVGRARGDGRRPRVRHVGEQRAERDDELDAELAGEAGDERAERAPAEARLAAEQQHDVLRAPCSSRAEWNAFSGQSIRRIVPSTSETCGRVEPKSKKRSGSMSANLSAFQALARNAPAIEAPVPAVVPAAERRDQDGPPELRHRLDAKLAVRVLIEPSYFGARAPERRHERDGRRPERHRERDVDEHDPPEHVDPVLVSRRPPSARRARRARGAPSGGDGSGGARARRRARRARSRRRPSPGRAATSTDRTTPSRWIGLLVEAAREAARRRSRTSRSRRAPRTATPTSSPSCRSASGSDSPRTSHASSATMHAEHQERHREQEVREHEPGIEVEVDRDRAERRLGERAEERRERDAARPRRHGRRPPRGEPRHEREQDRDAGDQAVRELDLLVVVARRQLRRALAPWPFRTAESRRRQPHGRAARRRSRAASARSRARRGGTPPPRSRTRAREAATSPSAAL